MTEKILIPLDGSSFGEGALNYVIQLVAQFIPLKMPEFTLLHVISTPIRPIPVEGGIATTIELPQAREDAKQKATEYLEEAGESLRRMGAIVNCKVIIGELGDSSAVSIIKAEQETNADLVAMSTHGRRGLTRWAFGSVTEKVLRGGSVPVLMVRMIK
jgi:nucleotide-binding universal stress UspA family protein